MTLKQIVKYLLSWRLATIAVAALAAGSKLNLNYLANVWTNFAGMDFLDLARYGYGHSLKPATYIFFPLFPWLINQLTQLTHNYLASGLIISHLSLAAALYFLYKLTKLDYKEDIAKLSLMMLMIFPTSFFFGSVYTESFFLLLVVLSFYFVRKKFFFLACLMGLLASATMIAGIFVWPALIWEIWRVHKFKSSLIWLILPPLGLLSYMKFLLTQTGDAFYFLKVTPDFGPNLVIGKLILLHQVFYRYLKMLVLSSHTDITFAVILLEFIVGAMFLILTVFAFKKMRLSYAIYMLLSYLVPSLTGTFASQPRYILTVFPAFVLLALWYKGQSPLVKRFYIAVNLIFAVIAVALFTRGYFIG